MKNREEHIYTTFATTLNALFDELKFYIAYQNDVSDLKKYGLIYNLNRDTDKIKKIYFDKESPKERQTRTNHYTLQIEIHSNIDDALSYADAVVAHLRRDKTIYFLAKNGLKIKTVSELRNLPEKYKNKWHYVRSFDVVVESIDVDEFEVDYITTADVHKAL